MGRRRTVAAAFGGLTLVIAATAVAEFTPGVYLSPGGGEAAVPKVAVADDGDAIAAWRSFDGTSDQILARTISPTGVRGPVLTLTGAGQDAVSPEVGTDDDGDAFAVWRRFKGTSLRIQGRAISAASEVGATLTLSADGQDATDPALAVDGEGDAIAVWRRFDGTDDRVQARTISAAGDAGPILDLSAPGQDASGPQVAVDDDGDAIAVWRRFDGSKFRIQGRAISASGVVGPILDLSAASVTAAQARIGVDADGDAIAAWLANEAGDERIEARPISSSGVPSETVTITSAHPKFPDLAIDADGDALVVWQFPREDETMRIHGRRISVDGDFGSAILITPGEHRSIPRVAIDGDGDAVVIWTRRLGPRDKVVARTVSATDVLGVTEVVSEGRAGLNPQIGIDAGGQAFIVWERLLESSSRIQYARGP